MPQDDWPHGFFRFFLDCVFEFRPSPFAILSSSSLSSRAPPAPRPMSAARVCCQTFALAFCPCRESQNTDECAEVASDMAFMLCEAEGIEFAGTPVAPSPASLDAK